MAYRFVFHISRLFLGNVGLPVQARIAKYLVIVEKWHLFIWFCFIILNWKFRFDWKFHIFASVASYMDGGVAYLFLTKKSW